MQMLSVSRSLISILNSLSYTGIGKEVHSAKTDASREFVLWVQGLSNKHNWERLVWIV